MSYYKGIADGYDQNGIPMKTLDAALKYCRMEVIAKQEADWDKIESRFPARSRPKRNNHER